MATSIGTSHSLSAKAAQNAVNTLLSSEQFLFNCYQLSQNLQRHLELRPMLAALHQQLLKVVPFDGLCYEHEQVGFRAEFGRSATHKVNYRLKTANDDLGELTISRKKRFTEVDLAILEHQLTVIYFPLRNALLYREAIQASLRDPLTGLGNRKAMTEATIREISLAARHQRPLTMVVIDLDHFKSINDRWGHDKGDLVLQSTANAIRQSIRQSDLAFRYGGEEFVLLLHKTDMEGAMVIANRISARIYSDQFSMPSDPISVTASIGIAQYQDSDNATSLFQRADTAMYQAKQAGRDRIITAA